MQNEVNTISQNQYEDYIVKFVRHVLDMFKGYSLFFQLTYSNKQQSYFYRMSFYVIIRLKKHIYKSLMSNLKKQQMIKAIEDFQTKCFNQKNQSCQPYKKDIEEFQERLKRHLTDSYGELELYLQEGFLLLLKSTSNGKNKPFEVFNQDQFKIMLKSLKNKENNFRKVSFLIFVYQSMVYNHSLIIIFGPLDWSKEFVLNVFGYLEKVPQISKLQNINNVEALIQLIKKFYIKKHEQSAYDYLKAKIYEQISDKAFKKFFFQIIPKKPQNFLKLPDRSYFGMKLQINLRKIVTKGIQSEFYEKETKPSLKLLKQILQDLTASQLQENFQIL